MSRHPSRRRSARSVSRSREREGGPETDPAPTVEVSPCGARCTGHERAKRCGRACSSEVAARAVASSMPPTRTSWTITFWRSSRSRVAWPRLDEKLAHWPTEEPYAEAVAWLRCFRGIDTLTALSVAGRNSRLATIPLAARTDGVSRAWCPVSHSSGGKFQRGGLTKAGNSLRSPAAHRVELALPASPEGWIPAREAKGKGQPAEIIAISGPRAATASRPLHPSASPEGKPPQPGHRRS